MPFEKGHPPHPPKDGSIPGRSKEQARAHRNQAIVIRENVPPELYLEFYLAILQEKNPKLTKDEDGEWIFTCEERGGLVPTLQQKLEAIKELQNRAYGQAPQMVHLEGSIQQHLNSVSATLNLSGQLSPQQLAQIRQIALAPPAKPEPSSPSSSEVIDAEFVEVPAEATETDES